MTVETASFISQLDTSLPASGDAKSEGDNHLRTIKAAVKGSFPNLGAQAVTATTAELNYLVGVTSGIQAQMNAEAAARAAGDSLMLQANAVWVSGATYVAGDLRYSPITFQTYRRAIPGAGTTDPSLDDINWRAISIATLQVNPVAALDIDCSLGNYFTKTIAGSSAFTFNNATAGSYAFTLELTHTSGTVTWPASVKWPADIAPTLTTGKTHLFIFLTDDAGTRWRGAAIADYVN